MFVTEGMACLSTEENSFFIYAQESEREKAGSELWLHSKSGHSELLPPARSATSNYHDLPKQGH